MNVAVCGAGAIGAATALALAERGVAVTIIDRTGVAAAASGKSGGFLALDWCDGSPLEPLARRSFELHETLARRLSGERWGYRRVQTFAGRTGARRTSDPVAWVSPNIVIDGHLGTDRTTAQVDPRRFTECLVTAAQAQGAELVIGEITGLLHEGGGFKGVRLADGFVRADLVVLALGPWSLRAAAWVPLPPVFGLKGHSLLFETGDRVGAEALFLEAREENGERQSPEIFPRADGTTYVCALSSNAPLPLDPAHVTEDRGAFQRLEALARSLSPVLADSPVLARQACFRPVTQDGMPLIGQVPGQDGVFVATGHSVWGILNAPATGEAIAQLILDGETQVPLAEFAPSRMPCLDRARINRVAATRA